MSSAREESNIFLTLSPIAPVIPVRRVERKGSKKGTDVSSWREIFMDKLRKGGVAPVEPVDEIFSDETAVVAPEEPLSVMVIPPGEKLSIDSKEDFERVILMIRRMADNPEKLIESHLNLFTAPAPPGKMLNSAG